VAGPPDEPLAQRYLAPLQREVESLRSSGANVMVVIPDAESVSVFGPNLLDYRRSSEAAAAGTRQAANEAAILRDFWS